MTALPKGDGLLSVKVPKFVTIHHPSPKAAHRAAKRAKEGQGSIMPLRNFGALVAWCAAMGNPPAAFQALTARLSG